MPLDRRARWAVLVIAIAGMLVARTIRHFALLDVPHVQDEITYVLQAHTLSLGKIASPVLMPRAAFNMWFVDDRVLRFGIFPPGWPLLLGLGGRIGLENWVNPILHGLTTLMVGYVASLFGGRKSALLASALYAFSPQALVLASSVMSHTLIAACASIVLWSAAQNLLRAPWSPLRSVATGFALGMAACTRPLCMVVLCILTGAALLLRATRERRLPWREAIAIGVPIACCVALVFAYNSSLTGQAGLFPQNAYFNDHLPPSDSTFFRYHHGCNNLGFGRGCDYSIPEANHTLENAFDNLGYNWGAWLGLAGGGPLIFLAMLYACRSRTTRPMGIAAVGVVGVTVAAYSLYWHPGTCYGARFYHLALPAVIAAGALGISSFSSRRVSAAIIVACLAWNAFAIVASSQELSRDYWGTDDRYATLERNWNHEDAVVMIAFGPAEKKVPRLRWTAVVPEGNTWPLAMRADAALIIDTPTLSNRVVFAKYHPGLVDDLKARFPTRSFWIYIDNPNSADDTLTRFEDYVPRAEHDLEVPPDNFEGFVPREERPIPWNKQHKKTGL